MAGGREVARQTCFCFVALVVSMRGVKVRVLKRVRKTLRRLGAWRPDGASVFVPADEAWRDMMGRLARAEAERRLAAAAEALNQRH